MKMRIILFSSIIALGITSLSKDFLHDNEMKKDVELNYIENKQETKQKIYQETNQGANQETDQGTNQETNQRDILRTDFVQITTCAEQKYQLSNCETNGELIGFDDDFYYLSYSKDSYLEYMKYNRNNEEKPTTLYKMSNGNTALFHTIYNKKLYIAVIAEGQENNTIKVIVIDEEGNENCIDTYDRSSIPSLEGFEDSFEYNNQRRLNKLLQTKINDRILQGNETKVDNLNDRNKTLASFIDGNSEKASPFIESYNITSDNLLYLKEEINISEITIPGVELDKNMSDFHRLNRNLVMFNDKENIYVYNLSNHMYFKIEYNQLNNINEIYQSPIYNQNKIGFMVNKADTNEMFFHEITLETYY
jgi:hypothetical protein